MTSSRLTRRHLFDQAHRENHPVPTYLILQQLLLEVCSPANLPQPLFYSAKRGCRRVGTKIPSAEKYTPARNVHETVNPSSSRTVSRCKFLDGRASGLINNANRRNNGAKTDSGSLAASCSRKQRPTKWKAAYILGISLVWGPGHARHPVIFTISSW